MSRYYDQNKCRFPPRHCQVKMNEKMVKYYRRYEVNHHTPGVSAHVNITRRETKRTIATLFVEKNMYVLIFCAC